MRSLLVAVPLVLLAGCVSAPAPPSPTPRVETPPPAPPPPVAAASSDWRDWPLTPGDWSYTPDPRGSVARFGQAGAAAELSLRCDRGSRQVTLARRQSASPTTSLTVRTSSTARALTVQPTADGQVAAVLPATDALFDAMGFSRGRFVIQQPGGATLVVPAWAEILRVAEDCRG